MAEIDLLSQWALFADFWKKASKFFSLGGKDPKQLELPPSGPRIVKGEKQTAPACSKCKQKLPAATISLKTDGAISCRGCGEPMSVFPPPSWLKEIMPKVEQFFGAERDVDPTEGQVPLAASKSQQPVSFACPSCGGSLTITADSERTITCEYCEATAYLPDPLWKVLHPVNTFHHWYLRLRIPQPQS